MSFFKWEKGRQGGDYEKMKLCQIFDRADCYLIRYQEGYELLPHKDPVSHGKHFRLNIVLSGEGDFHVEDAIIDTSHVKLFRPDIHEHGVKNITSERTVLSFGIVI